MFFGIRSVLEDAFAIRTNDSVNHSSSSGSTCPQSEKDGWSDTEIMKMVGMKTLSMVIRYGITEEADNFETAQRGSLKAGPKRSIEDG